MGQHLGPRVGLAFGGALALIGSVVALWVVRRARAAAGLPSLEALVIEPARPSIEAEEALQPALALDADESLIA